ncbi:MAG: glycosyltransferase family 39 protein [Xenococcaceae cyanobacterium]
MFRFFIIILLILGIFFRFSQIDRKVYWFDEVYTSFRAAGYTSQQIDRSIFQNKLIAPADLQKFQQIKPKSTLTETISSLVTEDPQHPPLYFSIARVWMQMFGGSLTASRSLPALLSLFSLPLMYGLAKELFASKSIAAIATALLALSPFDILFAQTARQYSLLTSVVIGSSYFLLKAIKKSSWTNWILYSLACAVGLYTHPFFGLTSIGHAVFIIIYWFVEKFKIQKKAEGRGQKAEGLVERWDTKLENTGVNVQLNPPPNADLGGQGGECNSPQPPCQLAGVLNPRGVEGDRDARSLSPTEKSTFCPLPPAFCLLLDRGDKRLLVRAFIALAGSFILYIPWLYVLKTNSDRAFKATSWATKQTDILYLVKQWILSFSSLFFDLDLSSDNILNYLLRLPFIALIIFSIYTVTKIKNNLTKLFILTFIFVPFLLLAIPDLLIASRRSSVTRYLISCFPGVQLAVAYFLTSSATTFYKQQKLWRWGLALLFTCSIISCSISAFADTWWCKGVSYSNAAAAQEINKSQSAIVISDRGDGSLGKGNLISLSYLLNENVRILPLSSPVDLEVVKEIDRKTNSDLFLFKPSAKFWQAFRSLPRKEFMPVNQTLWKIQFDRN